MRPPQDQVTRFLHRIALGSCIKAAVVDSISEPHKVFYVMAVRCPGCHRHAAAYAISYEKPKKYHIATIVAGEIIGRTVRKH